MNFFYFHLTSNITTFYICGTWLWADQRPQMLINATCKTTICYQFMHSLHMFANVRSKKGKGFPYSLPSVGPRADPGVQAVSLQVTISHPPGSRLPLLSARPAVTFPAAEHHRPLVGTKLYCLVTEAHRCEQLIQGCYTAFAPSRMWTHDLLIASPMFYQLHHPATYFWSITVLYGHHLKGAILTYSNKYNGDLLKDCRVVIIIPMRKKQPQLISIPKLETRRQLVNTWNKLPHPGVDFNSLTSFKRTLKMLTKMNSSVFSNPNLHWSQLFTELSSVSQVLQQVSYDHQLLQLETVHHLL